METKLIITKKDNRIEMHFEDSVVFMNLETLELATELQKIGIDIIGFSTKFDRPIRNVKVLEINKEWEPDPYYKSTYSIACDTGEGVVSVGDIKRLSEWVKVLPKDFVTTHFDLVKPDSKYCHHAKIGICGTAKTFCPNCTAFFHIDEQSWKTRNK